MGTWSMTYNRGFVLSSRSPLMSHLINEQNLYLQPIAQHIRLAVRQ